MSAGRDIQERIRQWLSGDLRHEGERELDRSAERDSFLRDALEGYREQSEVDHRIGLDRLRERMNARTRHRMLYPWRIAAAVLLLVTAGGFWWINQRMGSQSEMATATEVEAREEPGNTNAVLETQEEKAPDLDANPNLLEHKTEPPSQQSSTPTTKKREPSTEFADPPAVQPSFRSTKPSLADESLAASTPPPSMPEATLFSDAAVSRTSEEAGVVYGQVLDDRTGTPLIGVRVMDAASGVGTTSGMDGYFRLLTQQDTVSLQLSYTGYASVVVSAAPGDTVVAVLNEDALAMEEVVVAGQRPSSEESLSLVRVDKKKESTIKVMPRIGERAYRKYIKRQLRYPEAAKQADVTGEVHLSFVVSPKGRPTNIQVEAGIGYGCDEEAIRLLEEGPDWEPAGRKGRYTVPFK